MKSRFSKITTSLALVTACGALNSCRLFGGGKYASQMEVETDVPESLEQGKPSQGPPGGQTGVAAANDGVPATSNLAEIPAPYNSSGDLPGLPGTPYAAPPSAPGGGSLTGLSSDNTRDLIDIPKPEFNSISVHNTRPPAEMLSLGQPIKPGSRMSLGKTQINGITTAGVVQEKVEPLVTDTALSDSEIASAPKAVKSDQDSNNTGIPLLLGGIRLSDFYQELHQPLLQGAVVENQVSSSPPQAADVLSVPPPPPASDPVDLPPGQ